MEKPKNIRKGLAAAGLGFAGVMLLSGCASDSEGGTISEVSDGVSVSDASNAPEITIEYYADGTRRVGYAFDKNYGVGFYIIGHCEGGDLVETGLLRGYSFERSVGHAACADNRLTPEDFAPLPQ